MTEKIERLPMTSDYVFKRVFSYEGNEDVLKDFLEAILNIKINKVVVKNPELIKNTKKEKSGILDIKVEINDGTLIDVEMQMKNQENIEERATTYSGKLIASQLQAGELYKELNKTIIIFILNFNYYKTNSYHNIAKMQFEETSKKAYVDMGYKEEDKIASKYIEMHFIEMPKFRKKNPNTEAKIDQWLWMIDGREEKVEMAEKENKEVKKAIETLNRISLDPKERERYESIIQAEFNRRVSENNFYKKGMEKGIKQKQVEIVKKLLEMHMEIVQIEEITGLTEKEIKEIQQETINNSK